MKTTQQLLTWNVKYPVSFLAHQILRFWRQSNYEHCESTGFNVCAVTSTIN